MQGLFLLRADPEQKYAGGFSPLLFRLMFQALYLTSITRAIPEMMSAMPATWRG